MEGQDDKHVVEHLYRKRFGSEPPFAVVDKGGFTILRDHIGPELKVSGREVLGIVADANDDLQARWAALTDRLRRTFHDVDVESPAPCGTIIATQPRVGIWLWPNNTNGGEIENFVESMIRSDDPTWSLASRYIEDIPTEHRQFSPRKTARAKIHAWLAARREPRRMGAAIGTGDLEITGALVTQFTDWLKNLFEEPA